MKKKLLILTTLLSLISSCSKPYFVEKEDFVFDPSEYILKRDKTEQIVDYYKVEYRDIDYEYGLSLSPLTCSPEEIMVAKDFFEDEQVHSLVDLYNQFNSYFDYYPYALGNVCKEFTRTDGYYCIADAAFNRSQLISCIKEDGTFSLGFLKEGRYYTNSLPLCSYLTAFTNNNIWGYMAYFIDNPEPFTFEENRSAFFKSLTLTPNLPYEVYFTKNIIYLIPKDENFSKKCFTKLNEIEDFHYFDLEKSKEYLDSLAK